MSYKRPQEISREDVATIHPASTFLKFQTIQEAENHITVISEETYEQGWEPHRHQKITMCLSCFGEIDPETCRALDSGWSITWCCGFCGYVKLAKDMNTTFLMGADKRHRLKPNEIGLYSVRTFPWVEDTSETACINQICMQLACVSHRGGLNLRQTLGDADFCGYSGIYDSIARTWCGQRDLQIIAVRLQGVIMLRFPKDSKNHMQGRANQKAKKQQNIPAGIKQEEREVIHFQLSNSKLTTASGKSHSISALVEHSLDHECQPIVKSKLDYTRTAEQNNRYTQAAHALGNLGLLLRMKLSGVHRKSEGETEQTLEQTQAVIDGNLEQRSWQFLSDGLTQIQNSLPNEGDYGIIYLNKPRNHGASGSLTVEKRGPINPASLREDFKKAFRISAVNEALQRLTI